MSKAKGSISGGSQEDREYIKSRVEDDFGEVEWSDPGWVCDLIADRYFPSAQLDHAELVLDVNRSFQSLGGLRPLPHKVELATFRDRALVRANDPRALQWLWSSVRRLYWLVYDVAPQFWQQQFSDRSFVATVLTRLIAVIVSVNPQRSPASQTLMALLHTSNRPFANH